MPKKEGADCSSTRRRVRKFKVCRTLKLHQNKSCRSLVSDRRNEKIDDDLFQLTKKAVTMDLKKNHAFKNFLAVLQI